MLKPYKNLSGKSNVKAYDIFEDAIEVVFGREGGPESHYVYTYESAGKEEVEKMKKLAVLGDGLGTMLATKPHHKHARKW